MAGGEGDYFLVAPPSGNTAFYSTHDRSSKSDSGSLTLD
jgi:hypothetical protein